MESIFKLGILLSVVDRVTAPTTKIGRGMDNLKGKVGSLGPAFDKFKTYGVRVATFGALMIHVLSGTVMATVPTQKALGELSSVGVQNLAALQSAGTQFSNQWSGTTKAQFISAAYDIKSGISSLTDEGVAEFTKLAAVTGKATKSTTAEMTSLFATGYGIYKDMYGNLSDLQFGEVFSAGISASVKNFKTTGSGMAQAISTLGATATTAKIPMEEQLSILGMLQATMTGSEAGTKYRAMMQATAGAGEKLKLSFTDVNNQLLSMPEILTRLKGKYGDTLDAVEKMDIQKAFGTQEAVAVIDLLYGSVGALTENTRSLSAAMRQGTGFAEQMAATMNQDIGAGIGLLAQRWKNLVEVIGNQLIPVLVPLFSLIGRGIMWLTRFSEKHESLTRVVVISLGVIAALAFVLGAAAAALGMVGLLAPQVITGIGTVKGAFTLLRTNILGLIPAIRRWLMWQALSLKTFLYQQGGIRGLASSINRNMLPAVWGWVKSMAAGLIPTLGAAVTGVWGFTTALLANPVTWVVIGVAALIAILVLLYRRFEGVRNVVNSVGDAVMWFLGFLAGAGVAVGKAFYEIISHPLEAGGYLFSEAIAFYRNLIRVGVNAALDWIAGIVPRFLEVGSNIWNALTSGVGLMKEKIGGAVTWVIDKFKGLGPALQTAAKVLLSFVFPPLAIALNWDSIKTGINAALNWIAGVIPRFLEAGSKLWGALTTGIKAMLMQPVEVVKEGLEKLRQLLPFSDAKEGPLSTLTLSGRRIMETIGVGVQQAAPGLKTAAQGALAGIMAATISAPAVETPTLADLSANAVWESHEIAAPKIPDLSAKLGLNAEGIQGARKKAESTGRESTGGKTVSIRNLNITLPNVSDAESFVSELKKLVEGYDA